MILTETRSIDEVYMNKILNEQHIKKITMRPVAYTKCALGGDFYKNDIEIIFSPDKYYPDYTELQDWMMENIDGKTLNIEDVIVTIYDYIESEYKPTDLKVVDHVIGCRTHFDVVVEK